MPTRAITDRVRVSISLTPKTKMLTQNDIEKLANLQEAALDMAQRAAADPQEEEKIIDLAFKVVESYRKIIWEVEWQRVNEIAPPRPPR